ncbi:MAG: hypothetical protein OEW69_03650 [Nitrospirota bacterium]|nr:hypothetical protein [Nitrospirota bacterium]MDH5744920.1 hypothetical protein [Candidatus Aminicenantes bacterium]
MKDRDKVQELLESLSPKPLPPELKKKLLSTAYRKQNRFQIITPVLGKVFSICCVLVVMTFVFDLMITDSEKKNLTAIMDGSQTSELMIELDLKEIAAELFKNEYDKSLNQWLIRLYKTKKKSAKFTNYQSIIDILKE